jgi:DNA replicative helicase MCM subunit Mcm2 (Cdc46/Mcm family)
MSDKKAYLLVKCPSCGFYNIAPIKQKTRLCVRCGKTVQIDHLGSRRTDNLDDARRLLSELNSRIGTQANNKVQSAQINPATKKQREDYAHQSGKGLLRTFQEDILPRFVNKEVQLSEIERECEKVGFTKEYIDKLLKRMIEGGQAYQPKKDWIRLL